MKTEYVCESCGYRGFPKSTIHDTLNYLTFYYGTVANIFLNIDNKHRICPKCEKRAMVSTYVSTQKPMNKKLRIVVIISGTIFILAGLILGIMSQK